MNIPEGILCSKTHEWVVECEDGSALVGITDWIVNELSDIVLVELPDVGSILQKDEVFATIESVKAANELFMPVSGTIEEINEKLIKSPELVNEDPYENWFIRVRPADFNSDVQNLMDYNDYIDEL